MVSSWLVAPIADSARCARSRSYIVRWWSAENIVGGDIQYGHLRRLYIWSDVCSTFAPQTGENGASLQTANTMRKHSELTNERANPSDTPPQRAVTVKELMELKMSSGSCPCSTRSNVLKNPSPVPNCMYCCPILRLLTFPVCHLTLLAPVAIIVDLESPIWLRKRS